MMAGGDQLAVARRDGSARSVRLAADAARRFWRRVALRRRDDPVRLPNRRAMVLAVLAATAGVAFAALSLDARFARTWVAPPGLVVSIAEAATDLAQTHSLLLGYALAALGLWWAERRSLGDLFRAPAARPLLARFAFVAVALAVAGLIAVAAKFVIGRARPRHFEAVGPFAFDPVSGMASWSGFPSGHAANAGAFAMALALLHPRWRAPILAAGLVLAGLRLVVRAHYPSDVLAGYLLGAAVAIATAFVFASYRLVFTGGRERPLRLRGRAHR